ncbi:MAG: ankyrin repeat domain-containing protein [Rickettsiales bacterium]
MEIFIPKNITSFDELDINQRYLVAAQRGILHEIAICLTSADENFNPNCQDHLGMGALHYSCAVGFRHIVKALLADERIDINLADKLNRPPLLHAWMRGSKEIVELLLDKYFANMNEAAGRLNKQTFLNILFYDRQDILGNHLDIHRILTELDNTKTDLTSKEIHLLGLLNQQ